MEHLYSLDPTWFDSMIAAALGLPVMLSLRVFDALEPKLIPLKFVLHVELTL